MTVFLHMQETLRLTAPPLLAWMDKHLRAEDAHTEQRVNDALHFISAIEHAGAISFSIKPGGLQTFMSAAPA